MSDLEPDPELQGFTEVVNERILRKPTINSYALILHTLINGQILYLVGWIRDTIPFKEFICNCIESNDINRYIAHMSQTEKSRILTEDFQSLLDDVIVNHSSKIYKRACEGREEFERNVKRYKHILQDTKIGLAQNPCGFPKGRKQIGEEELKCALRENEEETHIQAKYVSIYDEMEPLEEIYTGLDGKLYKTVYYTGFINFETFKRISPAIRNNFIHTARRTTLSDEITKMKWMTYDQAVAKLDSTKQYIIRAVNSFLIFHLSLQAPKRRHSL